MVQRVCRNCPVPGCGAKYLVRLANHLADVHLLDIDQRRKYLQEVKLQPKVKFVEYPDTTNENIDCSNRFKQQVSEYSQPRSHHILEKSVKTRTKRKHREDVKNHHDCRELKNWLTLE